MSTKEDKKMEKVDLSACPVCSKLDIVDELAFLDDLKCTIKTYQKNTV